MKKILFSILIISGTVSATAQPAEIASLRLKIAEEERHAGYEKDTLYINDIARLAYLHYAVNDDTLFYYARKALDLSKKMSWQKGMAESLRQIGNGYMFTGDFDQALTYYQQSLTIAKKINDKKLICLGLSNIGLNYSNIGKFDDALGYTLQAYKLATEIGEKIRIAGELDNLGEIFFAKKEYAKALDYARRALQMAADLKNYYYMAYLGNSLGGMLYSQGQYAEALNYYTKSLDFYYSTDDQLGITNTKLLIAKVYFKYKNYPAAAKYATESLRLAETKKGKKDIADAAQILADIFENKGDYKNALEYLKKAKRYNDSLFNDQSQKKLFELQAKFKYDQEEESLKDEQAKKNLESSNMLQNQKEQTVIAALIIFMLAIIVIVLYKSRAEKLKINRVLEEKNIEISLQNEEIEKKAAELRVSNGQKDKLFSVIAHDLRSPLISLQGLLTLFKDESLPVDKVKEILAKLDVNVDQTVGLVTNLLQWASSQMNGVTVNTVSFSISGCIAEAVAGIQKAAVDKGIVLHYQAMLDLNVLADRDMIQVVLRNLLSNAVKFCNAGDSISVSAERKGEHIEVCIGDTGVGISPDILQKINNSESVTTYGTSKEKGTGLGLLLCKDFIARNNGAFYVESGQGRGSRFGFTLKTAD